MTRALVMCLLCAGSAFADEPSENTEEPDLGPEVARLRADLEASLARERHVLARLVALERPAIAAQLGFDNGLYLQVSRGKTGPGHSISSRGIFDERPPRANVIDTSVPFELQVGGGVQSRYVGLIRSSLTNQSGFSLARAQLGLRVTTLGWLEVQALFDFGQEDVALGAAGVVRDVYLDLRPTRWLTIRAGQFKVPLGRERLVSGFRLLFPDRSLATRALTFDRDLGFLAEARLWNDRLRVDAAVTNGADASRSPANDNLDLAYTLRLVASPLGAMPLDQGDLARSPSPRLSVGVAAQYSLVPTDAAPIFSDLNRDGHRDNVELWTAAVELAFRWRGFAVEGEYLFRHERHGGGFANRALHGGYGQLSLAPWRGLVVGVRASYADFPSTRAGLSLPGVNAERGLAAGGLVGYTFFGHALKALCSYEYRRDTSLAASSDGHQLVVQLQAGF